MNSHHGHRGYVHWREGEPDDKDPTGPGNRLGYWEENSGVLGTQSTVSKGFEGSG